MGSGKIGSQSLVQTGTNGKMVGDDHPVPVPHFLSSAMLAAHIRAVAQVTSLEFLGFSSR